MRRRRLRKLVVLVVGSSVAGIGLGVGIASLLRDRAERARAGEVTATIRGSTAGAAQSSGTAGKRTSAASSPIRVRVLDAVLHPAETPSGQARRRARLTVRIRATNPGDEAMTPARPLLLVGNARVPTDPDADSPETHLGELAPARTGAVTLRFEVQGAVTGRLETERRARIHIAGRTLGVSIRLGPPADRARRGR